MVVLFVVDEAEDVQRVSEVDEAVGFVGFGVVLVSRQLQVVEVVLVVLLEIGKDLFVGVPARDVLDHQVGSSLLSSKDLLHVDWPSVVLARG